VSLAVPGLHNRSNAACAATAADFLEIDKPIIVRAFSQFQGLPHRLQFLGEKRGRFFFNDSKSTSPAATLAALDYFARRTWLLLGGADVGADFADLCNKTIQTARGVAVFGAVAAKLHTSIQKRNPGFPCHRAATLPEAFSWCAAQSKLGDTILLSPACPSTDEYRDFIHRGEEFERLVLELAID
jgi:UDP-N-acetylmuramoylalanine--D-glutamate ligase